MKSIDQTNLEWALIALQGTASQFAVACIRDERIRRQYGFGSN